MLVDPDTNRDPNQRGNGHRPTDEPKHAQTEPDISGTTVPRPEFSPFFQSNLMAESPSCRSYPEFVIVTHDDIP